MIAPPDLNLPSAAARTQLIAAIHLADAIPILMDLIRSYHRDSQAPPGDPPSARLLEAARANCRKAIDLLFRIARFGDRPAPRPSAPGAPAPDAPAPGARAPDTPVRAAGSERPAPPTPRPREAAAARGNTPAAPLPVPRPQRDPVAPARTPSSRHGPAIVPQSPPTRRNAPAPIIPLDADRPARALRIAAGTITPVRTDRTHDARPPPRA